MTRAPILAPLVALLVLAGCGSSSKSSSSPTSTPATPAPSTGGAVAVSIKNLAFIPSTVQAKVGQTVTWTDNDAPPHNVIWVSGPKFASSSTLESGSTYSIKVTTPGTIHYFCSIHPFMKGTIVVAK
jgi:amicyanin